MGSIRGSDKETHESYGIRSLILEYGPRLKIQKLQILELKTPEC